MLTYALRLATTYSGMVMATFPDIPEASALGRDHDEALEQAQFALEAALERYVAEGRDLPEPRAGGALRVSSNRPTLLATA